MKRVRTYSLVWLASVLTHSLAVVGVLEAAGPQNAGVDLSMRRALYFNGVRTDKVDTRAKYVTENGTMTLNSRRAVKHEGEYFVFNLGFFVFRKPVEGELSTYALIRGPKIGIVGNNVIFQAGAATKDVIYPVNLLKGKNTVVVEVDPYKKTMETDETNNSFEVTIVVE